MGAGVSQLMIAVGDTVRVYPHGSPEQVAEAVVDLISRNERSIALHFTEKPPFATIKDGGILLNTETFSITMLLRRERYGPWVEVMGGGHYEIEDLSGQFAATIH